MLRFLAVRLPLLRVVDAAEADAFRVLVVEHFEGVAIEDTDDFAREVAGNDRAHERPEEKEERGNKKAAH